jgi:MFS family permease
MFARTGLARVRALPDKVISSPVRARPNPRLNSAVADWRAFAARPYRPFRALAVAQGFIGALTGPAITIPLLLALGAHPALATAIAVLPAAGTMTQRWLPKMLDRTNGNLRGLVVVFATIGEPRGLLLAAVVSMTALGWLPAWGAIALIGVVSGVLGALGAMAYSLQQSWYQIILPEEQRRLIAPRLGGIALGIGSVILLPIAFTIDGFVAGVGLWAYAVPLLVAGLAGLVPLVILRRLPAPGRIRIPRGMAWGDDGQARLRRHGNVMTLALLSAGLSPFLSVYAISVLGTGAGFAIAVSAVSSATLVICSLYVSSHLRGGSSSRLLHRSFLLRGAALFLGLAAAPVNPFAPLVLVLVAILMAAGDTAGQLAANERLMRLATGPGMLAFQSHFVVRNVGAYTGGVAASSVIMLLGGYPAFAILFVAAGVGRFAAARATEISAPAAIPSQGTSPA